MNGNHRHSERTPLLRPTPSNQQYESAVYEDDIQDAQVAGEGVLSGPQFPALGKQRSYSSSHWLAPEQDPDSNPQPNDAAQFGEDGLLSGLERTRFRCIIGGVFMGYFVSFFSIVAPYVLQSNDEKLRSPRSTQPSWHQAIR